MPRTSTPLASDAVAGPRAAGRPAGWVRARAARLDPAWRASLAVAWRAAWTSRLLVWSAGVLAVLIFGAVGGHPTDFDPRGLTRPFGALGDTLLAPAARWDAVWYLSIAGHGYDSARAAFFPLYPGLIALLGLSGLPAALAGIAVSAVALVAALAVLHRLAVLEIGAAYASAAVLAMAFFPAAFFFSAIYGESLFLLLSVGAFYAARTGRWGWAGCLGALAAATRSGGILLLVPLLLIALYGPRADRAPRGATAGSGWRRVLPRYAPGAELGWLALVPLGLLVFVLVLALSTGDGLAPFRAQDIWGREFAGPFGGAWDGAVAAFDGARQLLSGSRTPVYFTASGGDPFEEGWRNLGLFAFLLLAVAGTVGAFRRLPVAYGAWAACSLALPLSYPVAAQPLMSLPRFVAVMFPIHLWLALRLGGRRVGRVTLVLSSAALAGLTTLFACWWFVA